MHFFLQNLKLIRKNSTLLFIIVTVSCTIFILPDLGNFEITLNKGLSVLDFIKSGVGILSLVFLSGSIIIFFFNAASVYKFSNNEILEYKKWFIGSLLGLTAHSVYRVSISIAQSFRSDLVSDVLFSNWLFTVKRVWKYSELRNIMVAEWSRFPSSVKLTDVEVNEILGLNSGEAVLQKTSLLCQQKLDESLQFVPIQKSLLSEITSWIYQHPVETVLGVLVIFLLFSHFSNFLNNSSALSDNVKVMPDETNLVSRVQELSNSVSALRESVSISKANITIISNKFQELGRVVNLHKDAILQLRDSTGMFDGKYNKAPALPDGFEKLVNIGGVDNLDAAIKRFPGEGYKLLLQDSQQLNLAYLGGIPKEYLAKNNSKYLELLADAFI